MGIFDGIHYVFVVVVGGWLCLNPVGGGASYKCIPVDGCCFQKFSSVDYCPFGIIQKKEKNVFW